MSQAFGSCSFPSGSSFNIAGHFAVTVTFPDYAEAGPLDVTNVQKLSLDPATPLATVVAVSDGFYVSGFGDARDGFYFPGATVGGDPGYIKSYPFLNDSSDHYWQGPALVGNWTLFSPLGNSSAGDGTETNPWQVDWSTSTPPLTLTHPATQALSAASSAQGGVFVDAIGVFVPRGENHAKPYFNLLGSPDNTTFYCIEWHSSKWFISTDSQLYYSLSDVASPDLASDWKNVSDDSPASISVTSLSVGRIGAGVKCDGLTFQNQGAAFGGYPVYACLSMTVYLIHFDGKWNKSTTPDDSGIMATSDNDAVAPDLATWTGAGLTVSKSDVANEANWIAA